MGNYTKCAWCGRTIEKSGWNKFVSYNTMGLAGKQKDSFCSKKCQMEAEAAQSGGRNQGGAGNFSEPSVEAERQKEKVIADKEIKLKQMDLDEERRKEEEIKEAKAKKEKETKIEQYKSENKKFLAFLHSNRGLTIFLFFFILPLIFGIIGNRIAHGSFFIFFIIPMIIFGVLYILDFIKK